jgi:hypothetical protein
VSAGVKVAGDTSPFLVGRAAVAQAGCGRVAPSAFLNQCDLGSAGRAAATASLHAFAVTSNKESAMDDMKVFVPITKIDAGKRLVYGVVTAEAPDVAGEVCDYASTKPLYQKWSQSFASVTDGKSFGNLRAMHGAVAAGKLVDIAFNDAQKRIEICGKVVDDAEWAKVEEGVYTGFSQGGRYLNKFSMAGPKTDVARGRRSATMRHHQLERRVPVPP